MTKYARVQDGFLTDVWRVPEDYPDTQTRDRALGPDGWVVVPDDAAHGAKDNGDGTYTNPSTVVQLLPQILSATAFQEMCELALGGNSVGRARFGEIIRAMETSADNEVFAAAKTYAKSTTFERAKTQRFLTLLRQKGVAALTNAEITAIIAAWPNAAPVL